MNVDRPVTNTHTGHMVVTNLHFATGVSKKIFLYQRREMRGVFRGLLHVEMRLKVLTGSPEIGKTTTVWVDTMAYAAKYPEPALYWINAKEEKIFKIVNGTIT